MLLNIEIHFVFICEVFDFSEFRWAGAGFKMLCGLVGQNRNRTFFSSTLSNKVMTSCAHKKMLRMSSVVTSSVDDDDNHNAAFNDGRKKGIFSPVTIELFPLSSSDFSSDMKLVDESNAPASSLLLIPNGKIYSLFFLVFD
jgi:hypothetical protein